MYKTKKVRNVNNRIKINKSKRRTNKSYIRRTMKERFKQAQKEQSEKRKNRIRNEDFILGFLPNLITVNSENTHTQT